MFSSHAEESGMDQYQERKQKVVWEEFLKLGTVEELCPQSLLKTPLVEKLCPLLFSTMEKTRRITLRSSHLPMALGDYLAKFPRIFLKFFQT